MLCTPDPSTDLLLTDSCQSDSPQLSQFLFENTQLSPTDILVAGTHLHLIDQFSISVFIRLHHATLFHILHNVENSCKMKTEKDVDCISRSSTCSLKTNNCQVEFVVHSI